jgi:hypothetical protein
MDGRVRRSGISVSPSMFVAIAVALLIGLGVGRATASWLGADSGPGSGAGSPSAAGSPMAAGDVTAAPTIGPSVATARPAAKPSPAVTPPSGGLSLAQAMAALDATGFAKSKDVTAARILPGNLDSVTATRDWVWELDSPKMCRANGSPRELQTDDGSLDYFPCTASVVLDYWTGEYLMESDSPVE